MKKKYKYAKAIVDGEPLYDLIDIKGSINNHVKSYDLQNDNFIETIEFSNKNLYTWVIESETISYEMFINSLQVAILLLEKEYEEKNI